jgi:hypothetical protein
VSLGPFAQQINPVLTLQFVKERGYGNAMYDIVPSIACIVILVRSCDAGSIVEISQQGKPLVLGLNRWRRCSGIVLMITRSGSMSLTVSDLTSPLHRFNIYLRRRLQSIVQTFAVILHHIHIMISTSLVSAVISSASMVAAKQWRAKIEHSYVHRCQSQLLSCVSDVGAHRLGMFMF